MTRKRRKPTRLVDSRSQTGQTNRPDRRLVIGGVIGTAVGIAALIISTFQLWQGAQSLAEAVRQGGDAEITIGGSATSKVVVEKDPNGGSTSYVDSEFILTNVGRQPITILGFTKFDHSGQPLSWLWSAPGKGARPSNIPAYLSPGEVIAIRVCDPPIDRDLNKSASPGSWRPPLVVLSDGRTVGPRPVVIDGGFALSTVKEAAEGWPEHCDIPVR